MKRFSQHIHSNEIDIELFESFKKRLFSDYSDQGRLQTRWKSKPAVLSQTETTELFELLKSYSKEENNQIQQIKQMKDDNNNFQNRIFQLENQITELKNAILKPKIVSYQNDHNGIIQELTTK
jgi:hypothetical protein